MRGSLFNGKHLPLKLFSIVRVGLFIITIFLSITLIGQDSTALVAFERHYQQAGEYNKVSLYAECIDEINAAIDIAIEQNWEERECDATIFLAEIKRKTEDPQEGLAILYNLEKSIDFPRLHVKKLGRIAALYNRMEHVNDQLGHKDSAFYYLDSALYIAKKMNLRAEQAGLYNELGFIIGVSNSDTSLFYLNKAAQLFASIADTPNYVVAQTNIMRTYAVLEEFNKVEPIIDEIFQLLQNRSWNSLEVKLEFYRTLTFYYYSIGDSLNYNKWSIEKFKGYVEKLKIGNSSKLNAYRVLYETKKYQDEATKKAELLSREERRRKELIIYLSLLLLLVIGTIFLFIRERKLKKDVDYANERYHMLIVESNHRIKNNLQMIISMLEYANKDLSEQDSLAFKRMSGKIQTVSALHEHLYIDVHNERVDINTYFDGIIKFYHEISNGNLRFVKRITMASIQSERIVYFGLIFNEMLSNTLEHSGIAEPTAHITVEEFGNHYQFTYQDNSSFDTSKGSSMGTNLIAQLVKRIEGFNFKVEGDKGKYQFEFYD